MIQFRRVFRSPPSPSSPSPSPSSPPWWKHDSVNESAELERFCRGGVAIIGGSEKTIPDQKIEWTRLYKEAVEKNGHETSSGVGIIVRKRRATHPESLQ